MEEISCNLCGSSASEVIYRIPDWMFERDEVTSTLVRCQNCRLVYQNPRPTIEEMNAHYPDEYDCYHGNPVSRSTPWLLRKVYAYGVQKRTRTVTRHLAGGRLLDVGCATGNFLLGMANHPEWAVEGVEINSYAAAIAREQGLKITTGTLAEANLDDSAFDAVTFWDVFEHLHDPSRTLQEVARILRPGGLLIMRVPNLASWDAKIFGKTWAGFEPPRHTYVFTPATLRAMLKKNGFRVKSIRCNIGSYPTFVLSVRFWLTSKKVSEANRSRIIRFLESPFMRILTAPVFFIANLGVRGPLMIVTAEI